MEKKKSSTGLRYMFAGSWFMLVLCLMVLIPGRVLAEEDKGEYLDSFEWTDSQGITWEGDAYEKEATLIRCDKGVRELTLPAYIEYKGKQIPVRDVGLNDDVHDTRPSGFDPQGILEIVHVPEGIEWLGGFRNCKSLKSINFPASLKSIGEGAFLRCSSLTGISKLPSQITFIGDYAFMGCTNLHMSVTLQEDPDGTSLSYQFKDSGITDITLPNNMWLLFPSGLTGCKNLKSITVKSGGNSSFCSRDGVLYYKDPDGSYQLLKYPAGKSNGGKFTVPKDVYMIGSFAFDSCNFSEIVLPDGLHNIPEGMMVSIDQQTDPNEDWSYPRYYGFDNMAAVCKIHYDLLAFDDYNEETRKELMAKIRGFAALPSGKKPHTWIGELRKGSTYTDKSGINYQITKTTTGKTGEVNVTGVYDYAKESLMVPDTVTIAGKKCKVTAIKAKAFKNWKKQKSLTIGKYVTTIGTSAFANCKTLTTVTLGKGVTTIGKSAFAGDKKLAKITIQSTKLTSVGKNAFKGISAKATIKVPAKKLSDYQKLLKGKGQGKKVVITK